MIASQTLDQQLKITTNNTFEKKKNRSNEEGLYFC